MSERYRYIGLGTSHSGYIWTPFDDGLGCTATGRALYAREDEPSVLRCFLPEDLELIEEAPKFTPPPPRSNLQWVGVDLDETLAQGIWTPENPTAEIGGPIDRNVAKVRALAAQGWKIHVHTSRPWHEVEHIKGWLRFHGVPFAGIQCGKPLYAAYIDDRAIFAGDDDWTPKSRDARVSPR